MYLHIILSTGRHSTLQSALTLCLHTVCVHCVLTYSLHHVYLHTLQSVLSLYFQILYLGLGDTLHLLTDSDYFTGDLYYITFCATLTAFDYCILDGSCAVL